MIVRLMGGLGNQMFQYAMGKAVAKDRNETLYLDRFSYYRDKKRKCEIDSFKIKAQKISLLNLIYYNALFYLKKEKSRSICYEERSFVYQDLIHVTAQYYVGSWQNVAYFKALREELREEFVFYSEFGTRIQEMRRIISEKNAVAVHVRRGDYLKCSDYVVQEINYYDKAMKYILDRVENANFFIFSDDIEWCKKQFQSDKKMTFISGNTAKEDFFLMSGCRHYIISNSTFSWWAAWLADKGAIRIAPANWYTDKETNLKAVEALLEDFHIISANARA